MQKLSSIGSIVSVLIIFLILNIRRDGFFPFVQNLDDFQYVIISTSITTIFTGYLIYFFSNLKNSTVNDRFFTILTTLLIPLGLVLTLVLNYVAYRNHTDIYTDVNFTTIILIYSSVALGLIFLLYQNNFHFYFLGLIFAVVAVGLVNIHFFPTSSKISDLIPILDEQTESMVDGESYYQYYKLDNGIETQAVRQPGTIVAYLPAKLIAVDLRIASLLYFILFLIIIKNLFFEGIKDKSKLYPLVIFILTLLIIFPYRIVRSDLYDLPYWFILALSLYLLKSKKLNLFSIAWGLGIFIQVWSWIFTPFIFLYIYKNFAKKKFIQSLLLSLSIGIGLILIFTIKDFSNYKEHVFEFYSNFVKNGGFDKNSIYLSPLIINAGLQHLLIFIQFIACAVVGFIALFKLKSFKSLISFLIVTLFVFLQFNSLTWNYMYILLIWLMCLRIVEGVKGNKFKNLP